jgi:large subunit ribosomal protein L15
MVVRRKKKYKKYLGKRYARRGKNDRNRGAGCRGGRGNAGWRFKKQKLLKILKENPEKFKDKRGFVPPRRREVREINLYQLEDLIFKLKSQGNLKEEDGKIVINLKELGYNKLLGSGTISVPVRVVTDYASESAIEKIREAGGEVVTRF